VTAPAANATAADGDRSITFLVRCGDGDQKRWPAPSFDVHGHTFPMPPVTSISIPAGGTVGFAAVDLASGCSFGWNTGDPFPMQSVFKLPVAIEVLRQSTTRSWSSGGWSRSGRRTPGAALTG